MVQSRTKIKLVEDAVRRVVDRSLGLGADVQEVTALEDGWFNAAWRIGFSSGHEDLVLKAGPPDDAKILTYEHGIMRAEVEAMKLVGQDKRIPVPDIVFHDFSRSILPCDFFFMHFVQGHTWQDQRKELSPEANSSIDRQLGSILAAINSFDGQTFGYWGQKPKFNRWCDCFENMLTMLFDDARRYAIDLPVMGSQILGLLQDNRPLFDAVKVPKLVHWDLWPGNIIIGDDGSEPGIKGVLDFERVFWGDPVAEFSFGHGDREAFNLGYGQDLLASAEARQRRLFYDLYLHLVMVVEDGPRDYDDKGLITWAREQLVVDFEKLRG